MCLNKFNKTEVYKLFPFHIAWQKVINFILLADISYIPKGDIATKEVVIYQVARSIMSRNAILAIIVF